AEVENVAHLVPSPTYRHRKTLPDDAVAPDDGGVDADDAAEHVDQRTTGIAGIDHRVSLDERLETARDLTTLRAHDTGSHREREPERVAEREYPVAHAQVVRIAELRRRQRLARARLDLDDRNVRRHVTADDTRRVLAAIDKPHRQTR